MVMVLTLTAPLVLLVPLVLLTLLRGLTKPSSPDAAGLPSEILGGPTSSFREEGAMPNGITGGQAALPGLCAVSVFFLPRPIQIGQDGLTLHLPARWSGAPQL